MAELTPQELIDKLKECSDINRALRGQIIVMRSREARIEATEAGRYVDTWDAAYRRGMDDGAWCLKELRLQNEALKQQIADAARDFGGRMKTLSEFENDVKRLTSAFQTIERVRDGKADEYCPAIDNGLKLQSALFTSLAQMHALAALKAQELREERADLLAMNQDSSNHEYEVALNAERYNADHNILPYKYINRAGLARIQEIKRLLGEGGEEG